MLGSWGKMGAQQMAVWTADTTTEAGARAAARLGGFCCLIAALLEVLVLIYFAVTAMAGVNALVFVFFGVEVLVLAIAALRLRGGKGAIWSIFAALVLAFLMFNEVAAIRAAVGGGYAISPTLVIALCLHTPLLIGLLYGLRAAYKLWSGKFVSNDVTNVFG